MKLSKGLIAGILEKERKTNPKVHYISDITKANDFAEVVRIFNGRSIMAYGIEEIHEITAESNSLVIGLETLDNGKILAMERALRIAKKREVPVLLDLSGVNLSLYRKNTALRRPPKWPWASAAATRSQTRNKRSWTKAAHTPSKQLPRFYS